MINKPSTPSVKSTQSSDPLKSGVVGSVEIMVDAGNMPLLFVFQREQFISFNFRFLFEKEMIDAGNNP